VEEEFRNRNATLNMLKTDTEDEVSVSVSGPDTTVPNAENYYEINVYSTTEEFPEPEVTLNGETVELKKEDETTWSFREAFSSEGVQELEARITFDGYFNQNQDYYKAVDVQEKPSLLVLGDQGPLGDQLETFYDVDYANSVPNDLSEYYSIVAKEEFDETEVVDYVAEGNGLVYTGDIESEKSILPVSPSEGDDDTDGAKIMLVIDASHTTGTEGGTADIEESINIAYSLVDQLPQNNEVGAIAYQQEAYLISEPEPLVYNREQLKEDISSIETEGNTFHHKGLKGAEDVLDMMKEIYHGERRHNTSSRPRSRNI